MNNSFRQHILASLIATIYSFIIASTFFMLPIYFQSDLNLSTAQIGYILALMSITALLSMLPSGISNDFITSRRLASTAIIILILSFIFLSFTKTYLTILFLMMFIGGARELFRLSLETFIFKSNDINKMPISLGNFHGLRMFGLFCGMLVAALILKNIRFDEFLVIIGILLIIPLLLLFLLPDIPISKSTPTEYKIELSRPSIIVFMIFSFIFTSHWGAEYVNYGIFLSNDLLLSNSQSALYMSFEFLFIAFTVPIFGRYYRKIRIKTSTILAILLSGLGHIFMVNKNVILSIIFRIIHGIGDGLLIIISYMIIAENFSKERIGGLNASINVIMMAGMLIGAIIYGHLGERYGSGTSLIISGIITIFSIPAIYIWFYLKEKEKNDKH